MSLALTVIVISISIGNNFHLDITLVKVGSLFELTWLNQHPKCTIIKPNVVSGLVPEEDF